MVSPGRLGQVDVTWAAMEPRLWQGKRGIGVRGGGEALRFGKEMQTDYQHGAHSLTRKLAPIRRDPVPEMV